MQSPAELFNLAPRPDNWLGRDPLIALCESL
jgi:hypothetical protein